VFEWNAAIDVPASTALKDVAVRITSKGVHVTNASTDVFKWNETIDASAGSASKMLLRGLHVQMHLQKKHLLMCFNGIDINA
jgi:hypothetical protein